MNKLRHAKWFAPVIVSVSCLLLASIAFAATWTAMHFTTTGTITVDAPVANTSYHIGSSVLSFGTPSVASGGTVSIDSSAITVVNDGNQSISGYSITGSSGVPSWASLSITNATGAAVSGSGSFTVHLAGTAPTGPATVDLSGMTVDVTPN